MLPRARPLLVAALAAALGAGCARPAPPAAEPEELAFLMAHFQRYAEKLYLAGAQENWPLAAFYAHELEEAAEAVIAGGYEEDGVDLADLARGTFLPAVERVEEAVAARDGIGFGAAYAGVVAACNACHQATGHGFLRVVVPEDLSRPYPSQDFAPGSARPDVR